MATNSKKTGTAAKIGVMTLAIMNVAAVVSLRGLPAEAEYGLSSAFYYLFAAIVFLIPTSLVAAELAAMFSNKEGGVFRWVGEDSLLIGIDTGRFDTVINSVSITDERAEKYDFSDPYYYEARRVVVRADDDSINGPEDLNGKKIATNTTNAFIPWYEENGAEVVGIDTSAEAIDLVLSGRADFLGISVPVLNAYLDEHPDAADKLKAAFVIPNSEDVIAIPVRKGEPEFLDAINAALAELREEGTLKEISEKYLGGDYTNSAYSN